MNSLNLIVLGNILNPISDNKCEYHRNGAMLLESKVRKGKKTFYVKLLGPAEKVFKKAPNNVQILDYENKIIIPSFFDMHFHWVQDDVREMPKANLLHWLDTYTFPAERKFESKTYAQNKAKVFFKRLTAVGTLGGACYSSIHEHALEYAQKEALGDFVIGNVLMTMNSPKYLTQTSKEAISTTKKLSRKYKEKYALTPRFAIATDPETMKQTSSEVKKNKSFAQSHLSETKNEIDFVLSLYRKIKGFEKVKTYTEIYHKTGMLHSKSIMGHGIHLGEEDLALLSRTKTAIAHCPTSNAPLKQKGLGSGLFDFKKVEKAGIRWALGSDIGGGPFLSMLDVMRSFVEQNEKAGIKGATYKKALYRATLAGSEILKKSKTTGNLSMGKEANFIVLPSVRDNNSAEIVLKSLLNRGKSKRSLYDELPLKVFYRGQVVYSKD